jgi:hypothetical protein
VGDCEARGEVQLLDRQLERYKLAIEELKKEEKDEGRRYPADWWTVQSDYQPTECGDDGSR